MTVASDKAAQDAPLDVLIEADQMKTLLAVFRGIPHCKIGTGDGKALFIGPGLVFTATLSSYTAINLDTPQSAFIRCVRKTACSAPSASLSPKD